MCYLRWFSIFVHLIKWNHNKKCGNQIQLQVWQMNSDTCYVQQVFMSRKSQLLLLSHINNTFARTHHHFLFHRKPQNNSSYAFFKSPLIQSSSTQLYCSFIFQLNYLPAWIFMNSNSSCQKKSLHFNFFHFDR